DLSHGLRSQLRHREGSRLLQDADVAGQKLQRGVFGRYWPTIRIVEIGNERRQTASWHQQVEVVVEPWNPQKRWFPNSQHNRLPATRIKGSTELVRMAARAGVPCDTDTIMVDEFSAAAIDRAGTAAPRHGETRHPQQGRFDMERLVRGGVDVQYQLGPGPELAPHRRKLPRRIIRS